MNVSLNLGPKIFKYDSKGNLRVWYTESKGCYWRTYAGISGSKLVCSKWVTEKGNTLRTAEEQVAFKVEAAYTHKLSREYHKTPEKAEKGAHFFKPMLADIYSSSKFKPGYVQPKLDGIRCIATREGLWSRQGRSILGCPHIIEELEPLFQEDPSLVLDGELYNHDLKDNFPKIVSLVKKKILSPAEKLESANTVEYHVYDLPSENNSFQVRTSVCKLLCSELTNTDPDYSKVKFVETHKVLTKEEFDTFHLEFCTKGYEGSIWRDAVGLYEQKRSKFLQKRKDFDEDEFEIVGIHEGKGNWSGCAKRVELRLPSGIVCNAGMRGTQEFAQKILKEKHLHKVATVRYLGHTPEGELRMAVVTKFHGPNRVL